MSKIGVINYKDANWVWISDHYDIHLAGILKFQGKLCRFETDYETTEVSVYSLNFYEKIKWRVDKLIFEIFVGRHWSYPYRNNINCQFYWRGPERLHKFMFNAYYNILNRCK